VKSQSYCHTTVKSVFGDHIDQMNTALLEQFQNTTLLEQFQNTTLLEQFQNTTLLEEETKSIPLQTIT